MNELQVLFIAKKEKPNPDHRYRCIVTLMRADRPRFWNFLCNNCGSKIVELQGYDVVGLDDFYDPRHPNNAAVGRHCKGTLPDGLPCQYSYFFRLT